MKMLVWRSDPFKKYQDDQKNSDWPERHTHKKYLLESKLEGRNYCKILC